MSRRSPRPRGRLLLGVVAAIVVVVALGLVAYLTPLMSVRDTEINDNAVVADAEILEAAAVPDGLPLLQVNAEQVAQQIAAIPSVESARVQRSYPSTLVITIVERRPLVIVEQGSTRHVLDRSGVGYLSFGEGEAVPPEIDRLPVFDTAEPGPSDPTTRAAMTAVNGLPESLYRQVERVSATSPVDIELHLSEGRRVIWGDSRRGEEKARTLTHLLSREATVYNVTSPEFPAYR